MIRSHLKTASSKKKIRVRHFSKNLKMRRVSFARCAVRGRVQQQRWFGSTPSPTGMKELSESWSTGTSANYMEAMYQSYLQDPSSVHVSWRTYFANLDAPAGVSRVAAPRWHDSQLPSVSEHGGIAQDHGQVRAIEASGLSLQASGLRAGQGIRQRA